MNDQYYTSAPVSQSNEKTFELDFGGSSYRFVTDNGVFSKGELDDGTRILLEALPEMDGRLLDLGCGWGPVGVILGKKYPECEILMADVNERAVELSRKNLALNSIANAEALQSDIYENVCGTFDFIITNPPIRAGKQVIYRMFDEARGLMNPGGKLYIVIRKQQGAPSALKHLQETWRSAEVTGKEKSFWVIACSDTEQ